MASVTVAFDLGGQRKSSQFVVYASRTMLPPTLEVGTLVREQLSGTCVAELGPSAGTADEAAVLLMKQLYCGLGCIASPPMGATLNGWGPNWLLVCSPDRTCLWILCTSPRLPLLSDAPPGPVPAATTLPLPPSSSAPPSAPAAEVSLSFQASQLAGVDAHSKPYVGPSVPADVRGKRNFLFKDFPPELCEQLHMDEVAMHSVSAAWMAERICSVILALVGPGATITDGTACVGGDTIRFAQKFSRVNAVELSEQRAHMLYHNVKVCGVAAKVYVYNADYVRACTSLVQDVVFMDPPWGGPQYLTQKSLDMFLGPTPLADVCKRVWPFTKCIVLKLPMNFNQDGFRAALPRDMQVVVHDIGKALLLVVQRPR